MNSPTWDTNHAEKNVNTVFVITPSDGGGMLHYGSQMCNGLVEFVDVEVVVDKGADLSLFSESVETHVLDIPNSIRDLGPRMSSLLSKVYKLATMEKVDVVHLTALNPLFIPVFATTRDTTTVVTCHDVRPHPGEESLRATIACEGLVRLANQVVVHGDYNHGEFVDRFGSGEKLITVKHGSYEFFRDHCDAPIEYEPELLFFGRIKPYKGVERIIALDDEVSKYVEEFRITIAGEGKFPVDENTVGDNTTVIDRYVPNEEVCELFSRCRAVVLPYREASQSGVIPIAYSFSKPVITTPVGGIPENVQDDKTGILVNDQQDLVEACVDVLSHEARAESMGKRGFQFSQKKLSWSDICKQLLCSYSVT